MGAVYRSGQKLQTFHIEVKRKPQPVSGADGVKIAVLRKGRAGLEMI
jgi:hypothetical protein